MSESDRLVGLPEAAHAIGVHRATLNEMVRDGRVRAERVGAHWFLSVEEFERLKATYVRPKNSPRRREGLAAAERWGREILRLLDEWGEGTSAELSKVLALHPGNVRKYLALLEADDLAERDDEGVWRPVTRGAHMSIPAPEAEAMRSAGTSRDRSA